MKSEKRHELQKNELADWIGNNAEGAADYFWPVAGGIVVAFAVAIGIFWYMNNRDSASAAGWDRYYQAFSEREREPELKKVSEEEAGSLAGLWAKQSFADLTRSKGANQMFVDRPEGESKLKEAEEAYKEVLAKARDPFLINRANFGMARTQEALCQPERAREYYELVVKSEKDSSGKPTALGKAAEREAKRLARKDQVELIAWFATQKPKKPSPTGHGGFPGMPALNVPTDLPERPDFSIPSGLNLDSVAPPPVAPGGIEFPKPANAPATPESPKSETPASPDSKGEAPKKPGE